MKQATTSTVLWKKRMKKDGSYPVKLRVTFNREQRFYSIDKYSSLTEKDFEMIKSTKSTRGYLKNVEQHFIKREREVIEIINKLPEFSFHLFEKELFSENTDNEDVFSIYSRYIEKLYKENRIKTALSYNFSMVSIKNFCRRARLDFLQVTPEFLASYDKWMIENGKSITTIGFYLRNLRTIFNEAIQQGLIKQEYYPFGKRKYIIPAPRNIKKALTLEEIRKIYNYQPDESSAEEKWWSLWIFSFLCNGINIKDLAKLKYKNVLNDTIELIRSKTERTSRKNLKPISAHILPKMKEIIDTFGNKPTTPDDYIFPILIPDLSSVDEMKRIDNAIVNINKHMNQVAKNAGLDKEITTYTARHSFATLMRNEGASVEFIAEKLGHSDTKVTSNYLDSFPNELQKGWAEKMANALQNI